MADLTNQHLLSALSRAAAEPAGLSLYSLKSAPGLFPPTSSGRAAAERAVNEGFLQLVTAPVEVGVGARVDAPSRKLAKANSESYVLTEKGMSHLLAQSSPRPILEDFVRVLEARHTHTAELLTIARGMQSEITALHRRAEQVLGRVREVGYEWNGENADSAPVDWHTLVWRHLTQRRESGSTDDCPLSELFRRIHAESPTFTIGLFHDALRRLNESERIWLHPWTGPLYDLPEPAYALLVGPRVVYYASIREGARD